MPNKTRGNRRITQHLLKKNAKQKAKRKCDKTKKQKYPKRKTTKPDKKYLSKILNKSCKKK